MERSSVEIRKTEMQQNYGCADFEGSRVTLRMAHGFTATFEAAGG